MENIRTQRLMISYILFSMSCSYNEDGCRRDMVSDELGQWKYFDMRVLTIWMCTSFICIAAKVLLISESRLLVQSVIFSMNFDLSQASCIAWYIGYKYVVFGYFWSHKTYLNCLFNHLGPVIHFDSNNNNLVSIMLQWYLEFLRGSFTNLVEGWMVEPKIEIKSNIPALFISWYQ